jgi:SpoVK/Ycf46/Vps4 family AAA+-type ATPase
MKHTKEKIALEAKIAFLKEKQSEDFVALKQQYYATVDSFNPLNLIKSATQEFISSPDLKSSLINGAIGLGTTYLSKNLLNENSANPIKRVLGKVLKFTMKNFIGKKSKKI